MTKEQLAKELRERQVTAGYLPLETTMALEDDAIIESYITCSCCGKKEVEGEDLVSAIAEAHNADMFFTLCSRKKRERGN